MAGKYRCSPSLQFTWNLCVKVRTILGRDQHVSEMGLDILEAQYVYYVSMIKRPDWSRLSPHTYIHTYMHIVSLYLHPLRVNLNILHFFDHVTPANLVLGNEEE